MCRMGWISQNIALLSFLYIVQGIPYGLQVRFFPIYLRSQGTSLTHIGFFKLLLLPWVCKALWAPFVDRVGSKKQWLMWSMLALQFTCFLGIFVPSNVLTLIAGLLFVMNICTSVQDIAVDSLAIQILSSTELALGNIAQVVGFKLGAIGGGGIFLWLSQFLTWGILFMILTLTYMVSVIIVKLCIRDTPANTWFTQSKISDSKSSSREASNKRAESSSKQDKSVRNIITMIYTHFQDILLTNETRWLMVFVVTYKLGEYSMLSLLPLYLVDKGMRTGDVGLWTEVIGQVWSIAGSVIAGWLVSYYGFSAPTVVKHSCYWRVVPMFLQIPIVYAWSHLPASWHFMLCVSSILNVSVLLLSSGMITTAAFTMMMQCSQQAAVHVQATHFTLLATLEVVGKLIFSVILGSVVDFIGYSAGFILFFLMAIAVLPLFCYLPVSFHKHCTQNEL